MKETALLALLVTLLVMSQVRAEGLIDYTLTYICRINPSYFKAKIVTTIPCSMALQQLPEAWVPLGNVIYIPTLYSTHYWGQDFKVTGIFTCKGGRQEVDLMIRNRGGYLTFYQAKQDQTSPKVAQYQQQIRHSLLQLQTGTEIRLQQRSRIEELFDAVMRLETPAPNITIDRETATGQFYHLNHTILTLNELPTMEQAKALLEANDSYAISVTIQNTLNSRINCSLKATYLQEFSGYIDLHLNRLQLNFSQAEVVINETQKQSTRLKAEIDLALRQQQNLQINVLQRVLSAKMEQLDASYQTQLKQGQTINSLNHQYSKVRELSILVKEAVNKTSNISNFSVVTLKQQALVALDGLSEYSNRVNSVSTFQQLERIALEAQKFLKVRIDTVNRNYDQTQITVLQLQIDVNRALSNLQNANDRQQQLFRDLQILKQELFNTESLRSSFLKTVPPLKGAITQFSIYQRTIDEQLDLVYFHCFNVTSISSGQGNRVINIQQEQFQNYLSTAYNVEEELMPIIQSNMPSSVQAEQSIVKIQPQKLQNSASKNIQNLNIPQQIPAKLKIQVSTTVKVPSALPKQVTKTQEINVNVNGQGNIVQVVRTNIVNQDWMQKYGVTSSQNAFSCLQTKVDSRGFGTIQAIYEDKFVVKSWGGGMAILKISPCTRIETVRVQLPQVGRGVCWRGGARKEAIEIIGLAAL